MEHDITKKLDFDSDTFESMKQDMNFVLQRLIGNMIEKGSYEGCMTVKVDVSMNSEYVPNFDPDIEGESRECRKPKFKHKVTSVVKINDEKSGNYDSEMELVMDPETGIYVLRPVINTGQRSFFDADFKEVDDVDGQQEEVKAIEGEKTLALPLIDQEAEDISDELIDNGYDYTEPED